MARGATKRNQQARAAKSAGASRRKPSRGARRQSSHTYEEAMFFPRLRNHAKWVFVFLVIVFGLGFVVFGVGSGTGSFSLGDLFSGSNNNPGQSASASAAQKKIEQNPKNAAAWRELATASLTSGDTSAAINALDRYTQLKPKDTGAFVELAGLYQRKATNLAGSIQAAQTQASAFTPNPFLEPTAISPGTKKHPGQQIIGQPVIDSTLSSIYNGRMQKLQQTQKGLVTKAETAYQNIARLQPKNAQIQLQLGSLAYNFGDIPAATLAFKRYLVLAPHSQEAALVRKQLKLLQGSSQLTPVQPQGK
jgi:tetratricopeptide (TPR) repeat protein